MAIKVLMTWDILPGQEQEYFEFVVRDFIPGMQRMGLQTQQAWFTMYGDQPQIMAEALMPDLPEMQALLASDDWSDLKLQLMDYVEDFDIKVVQARKGFQM